MTIRFLVPQAQGLLIPRMLRATRLAIAWFGLYFGPCPHAQLTVVSPPPGAQRAGGMEYPALITTGASRLDASPVYSWRKNIESVTVHEIGHQYFQGMLASNEFEAAWLDEGLTSWAENRCLSDMVTDGLVPEIRLAHVWGMERVWASFEDLPVTMDRPNWEQRRLTDAFFASYARPALVVKTLEGVYGEDRLLRATRAYVAEHRYGHPTGADFQASLELSLGENLEWFFDAVVRGDERPDWAVLSVRHDEIEPADGMVWSDGEWTDGGDQEGSDSQEDGLWRVSVEIGRRGDLVGPVEVELLWADDRRERRTWDSRERWVRWRVDSTVRLRQVVVDPDGAWMLETRRADNYWRDEAADPNALWWLDGALRLVGFLTVPWS